MNTIEAAGVLPAVIATKTPAPSGSPSASPSNMGAPANGKFLRLKSTRSTTRTSKKAVEQAEQARREKYAQELFTELNMSVFKNGLPQETKLNWNKRLLTTAGRAKYRRYNIFRFFVR